MGSGSRLCRVLSGIGSGFGVQGSGSRLYNRVVAKIMVPFGSLL